MKKKYNILLFDLDDTLLDFTGDEKRALSKVLNDNGIPCGEDVIKTYYTIENWQTFEMGNITSKTVITTRFSYLLKLLEVKEKERLIDEYYDLMINSHKIISGTQKMLKSLKENGYKLYITTNGYPEFQRKRIKEARIEKYFDGIFISEEINLRKPSPSFYKYVFNRLPESNLSKVLIIGDAQTSDILGGINSGIDSCWYNPSGKAGRYKPTYEIKYFEELEKII